MFFILMLLIFTVGYSFLLFWFIPLSIWFLFLWIPLGFIAAILTIVIFAVSFLWIGSRTSPKHKFKHFILRNACHIAILFLHIRLTIVGRENVPKETFVIYANHKSNMDPLLIYYSLHSICSAIGKKSLFQNPIMKMVAKTYGAISLDRDNDREAAKSIVTAIKSVKNGLSMMIFPEGGIKSRETDEMVNLRAGAYKLATKSNAPILPVSIIGSSRVKTKRLFQRLDVKVIIHKPIHNTEYANMNTTELGHYVEEIINASIRNA